MKKQLFKQYLESLSSVSEIFSWVWEEMITEESKKLSLKLTIYSIISVVFYAVGPFVVSEIINAVIAGEKVNEPQVYILFALLVFLALGESVFDYFRRMAREWILGFNLFSVNRYITENQFNKSPGQHDRERAYLGNSNLEKGKQSAFAIQGTILFEFMTAILLVAISSTALFFISKIAWGIVMFMIFIQIVWMTFTNIRVQRDGEEIDKNFRKFNRHLTDRWSRATRVTYSVTADSEIFVARDMFDNFIKGDRKLWFWFIRQASIRDSFTRLGEILIIFIGLYLLSIGHIEVGLIYPLIRWVQNVTNNVWRIGEMERVINYNLPSLKSLRKAMILPPDVVDPENPKSIPRNPISIKVSNLSHRYEHSVLSDEKPEKDPPLVLQNVNLDIPAGSKVAIVGPSGAGKSTLMKLLLRFSEPLEGKIEVNGVNLKDAAKNDWYRLLGYVPQKPFIFDSTIRENIIYGTDGLSESELAQVVDLTGLNFGDRLVDGLDTKVGRDGIELSGGEAQRLSIAAAIANRPPFVVIDEATSSLDSVTERHVQAGIDQILSGDTTACIIAHRLSTVRNCNMFVVLRPVNQTLNGDSQVETVAHSFKEVYEKSPIFKELADAQGVSP